MSDRDELYMRETWEKKVMKFEREIPIGLDARRKKWQGGHKGPPPPMGLGVKTLRPASLMKVLQCAVAFRPTP